MDTYYLDSPLGTIKVRGDAAGIQEVCFVEACVNETTTVPDHLVSCVKQLQQYFEGKRQQFDFNINPQGTVFQKKIWGLLASLPFGRTLSYIKVARSHGNTKAVRAVAAAIGKNPILVAIPCHRVIGSDGSLVGYSGGIDRKRKLLQLEGYPMQTTLI
ncbi:methylated-DNA--[protein]-cysteine S-methyltransferase [Flavobacteriaceae bacterium]|nr:methylated-DNA--[protein]-cysteine S-methyltransferase [Flavobacteriaceae bacterium]MDA9886513.1 methylated-DNA--[protein]-cysteine S-methyltransferase [Flavobacteriaceae bacterium]MDB2673085.1 methylated-DNA--[protein]-cysteine S-methyltransferase [Flavobacteriaceae bacterium]MDB4117924.1 methylated-DNA--[protein]-cysteine S-methyltransferase [Flavobacteriaceae bacterium]